MGSLPLGYVLERIHPLEGRHLGKSFMRPISRLGDASDLALLLQSSRVILVKSGLWAEGFQEAPLHVFNIHKTPGEPPDAYAQRCSYSESGDGVAVMETHRVR